MPDMKYLLIRIVPDSVNLTCTRSCCARSLCVLKIGPLHFNGLCREEEHT